MEAISRLVVLVPWPVGVCYLCNLDVDDGVWRQIHISILCAVTLLSRIRNGPKAIMVSSLIISSGVTAEWLTAAAVTESGVTLSVKLRNIGIYYGA